MQEQAVRAFKHSAIYHETKVALWLLHEYKEHHIHNKHTVYGETNCKKLNIQMLYMQWYILHRPIATFLFPTILGEYTENKRMSYKSLVWAPTVTGNIILCWQLSIGFSNMQKII